jgi:hypothetical protein
MEWDALGSGGGTCKALCRALSREGGGGKELRATPARWLLFYPLKEVGTSCCDVIHKNSASCGFARAFESKDYRAQ